MAFQGLGSKDDSGDGDVPIVAEINITPLTDIFLVLLIIFMVTSSVLSQTGVDVQLPKSSQGQSPSSSEGTVVSLLPNGAIRIGGEPATMETLPAVLKAAFAKVPSRLVILEGDRNAVLGSAIKVMDEAKKAGAERFAISTTAEE